MSCFSFSSGLASVSISRRDDASVYVVVANGRRRELQSILSSRAILRVDKGLYVGTILWL